MIKIDRNTLIKRIQPLLRVATAKGLPVYECVLMESRKNEDTIRLSCTNGDIAVTCTMPLPEKSPEHFLTCVPARLLADMFKQLPEGEVTLELTEQGLAVIWNAGRSSLYTVDWRDFPSSQKIEEKTKGTLRNETLSGALKSVIGSTADDSYGRPALSSINFDCLGGVLNIVASDSHQLMCVTMNAEVPDGSFLLPEAAAQVLKGILAESQEETTELSCDNGHVLFRSGEYSMTSNLVNAKFPKYRGIIPTTPDGILTIDKALLTGTIKRSLVFANKEHSNIVMTFSEGKVTFEAKDLVYGMLCTDVIGCDYSGPKISVNIKGHTLLGIIASMQGERVELGVTEGIKPLRIRPAEQESENESQVAVLMPLIIKK